jgi:hypothetical protein
LLTFYFRKSETIIGPPFFSKIGVTEFILSEVLLYGAAWSGKCDTQVLFFIFRVSRIDPALASLLLLPTALDATMSPLLSQIIPDSFTRWLLPERVLGEFVHRLHAGHCARILAATVAKRE